jgi:hypothetical protein
MKALVLFFLCLSVFFFGCTTSPPTTGKLPSEIDEAEQPPTLGTVGIVIFGVVTLLVFFVVGDVFSTRDGT